MVAAIGAVQRDNAGGGGQARGSNVIQAGGTGNRQPVQAIARSISVQGDLGVAFGDRGIAAQLGGEGLHGA